MCTTVSTPACAITLAITGLRMSARTNCDAARCRRGGGIDVDADDPVDVRVGASARGEPAAEVPGDPGDEHDAAHGIASLRQALDAGH